MARTPTCRRLLALVAVAALVLSACGDDDTETTTATTAADETTTTTASPPAGSDTSGATTEPEPAAVPGTEDADQVVEVTVDAGRVDGGGRQAVALGDTVALVVRGDVDDEIHLHGYDLYADVVAGEPSVLRFEATIPGVFEVELHDAGLPLVELEVS